jgi:glucan phosphoethanolaminetransferase (alkaline phosphatase superfamily)
MITEKEKNFIEYWERVRMGRSSFINKFLSGLPVATMFGLPIVLLIVIIRIFFPEWYTKISNTTSGMFIVVVIAVVIAVIFYGYFRMHFKWEMNEQLYKELKFKQKKEQLSNHPTDNN